MASIRSSIISRPSTIRRSHSDRDGDADRVLSERTIPRVRDSTDPDPAPGVDPRVWLDHVRLAEHGDRSALARLVDEYDRYAVSLARRLYRRREPLEDLEQVAREALVLALRRFDPSRRLPFPAYATPTIVGAVRHHYRDHGWLVRVPRSAHDLSVAVHATTERLLAEQGRTPTLRELAAAMGVGIDQLIAAQDAEYARDVASIDAVLLDGGEGIGSQIGVEDPLLSAAADHLDLSDAIDSLNDSHRQILHAYYFEGRTQAQIADALGVSQMQVSRLLARILRHLRSLLAVEVAGDHGLTGSEAVKCSGTVEST